MHCAWAIICSKEQSSVSVIRIKEESQAEFREVAAVFTAGIIQGLALITFPAASAILTSPSYYGLTNTAYGAMFVPQAVTAISASLLWSGLSRRMGIKQIFLLGLSADLLSMALLFSSQFVMTNHALAYGMLLLATASLGIGFGLTVPSVNTYAAAFFPQKADSAVLVLNALLGLGTVLAPVFVAVFTGLGIWWGLPLTAGALLLGLLLFSVTLPLQARGMEKAAHEARDKPKLPSRFWVFAAFSLLYGIVETTNGNWATLYMSQDLGASTTKASFALTAFWGMVTAGRILFTAVEKWFPTSRTYHFLPFVASIAMFWISSLSKSDSGFGILAFGLAGLGCSALLPLTISFGQQELTVIAVAVAGGLIAFYQIGYGIAAFGVGPLVDRVGLSLNTIFLLAVAAALMMGMLSFVVIRRDSQA
jgi:MFS family permease